MHYNNFVELLATRARMEQLEEQFRLKAQSVGIRMLEIDASIGLLTTRIPAYLTFAEDPGHSYTKDIVHMEYGMGNGYVEYVTIPVDYIFSGDWELKHLALQEGKAQLKRNSQERNVELLKRVYKLKAEREEKE